MARNHFLPRLERVEDRRTPAVVTPGVVTAPTDFYGGVSLLVDFDRDLNGTAIPESTPISDQYAGLGVRFSLRGRTDFPETSSRDIVDAISPPNSLYVSQSERTAGATTVVTFDPAVRNPLPTAVSFVFTDGPPVEFTVRAYDAAGAVVDQATINTANNSFVPMPGDTEDTFIGLKSAGGIARLEYNAAQRSAGGVIGYEIDNLRFNTPGQPLPPPPPGGGGGGGVPPPGVRPPDLLVASADVNAQTYRLGANDRVAAVGGVVNPFGLPGPVRAASGDVDGDGATDTVYVTGPGGGGLIRVVSGRDGSMLLGGGGVFNAFPGENVTTVGMFVAVADVTADGRAEVIVSPDRGGGPRVQIFSLTGGTLTRVANFFGITGDPNFRGGARIAAGNFDGDEFTDLVVSAGILGGPRVAVFDGASLTNPTPRKLVNDFFVFEASVRDGVYVGAGDLDGDGQAEMVFGGGPGGGPRVMVLKLPAVILDPVAAVAPGNPFANFFAFDSNQRGGVRVAVKRVDGEDRGDLIVGSGDGATTQMRVYRGSALSGSPTPTQSIDLFGAPPLATGVFVG